MFDEVFVIDTCGQNYTVLAKDKSNDHEYKYRFDILIEGKGKGIEVSIDRVATYQIETYFGFNGEGTIKDAILDELAHMIWKEAECK